MKENVISMYQYQKQNGKRVVMTDELIDALAEEYMKEKVERKCQMTFQQWVEYRMVSLL